MTRARPRLGTSSTGRPRCRRPCRSLPVAPPFAPLGAAPLTLLNYDGPVSNSAVTVNFRQPIDATDGLRSGSYSKTLTFTLSTTTP